MIKPQDAVHVHYKHNFAKCGRILLTLKIAQYAYGKKPMLRSFALNAAYAAGVL